jgi:phosphopantothenoylcysteine decarboxylase/phosphopantothenate--cysteine ligase
MIGDGRLAPIEDLVGAIRLALGGRDRWRAGASWSPPAQPMSHSIRYASSATGRAVGWGFALAQQLLDRGASVDLVAGPTALPRPYGANCYARRDRRGDAGRDRGGRGTC